MVRLFLFPMGLFRFFVFGQLTIRGLELELAQLFNRCFYPVHGESFQVLKTHEPEFQRPELSIHAAKSRVPSDRR